MGAGGWRAVASAQLCYAGSTEGWTADRQPTADVSYLSGEGAEIWIVLRFSQLEMRWEHLIDEVATFRFTQISESGGHCRCRYSALCLERSRAKHLATQGALWSSIAVSSFQTQFHINLPHWFSTLLSFAVLSGYVWKSFCGVHQRCWCRSMDSRQPSRRIPSAKHPWEAQSFGLLWVIRPSQGDHGIPLSDVNEENPALLRAESLSTRAIPQQFRRFSLQFLTCPQQRPRETNCRVGMGAGCRCRVALLGSQYGPCGSARWNTHWLSRGGPQAWSAADLDFYRFVQ